VVIHRRDETAQETMVRALTHVGMVTLNKNGVASWTGLAGPWELEVDLAPMFRSPLPWSARRLAGRQVWQRLRA
jgi:hypothetical protein